MICAGNISFNCIHLLAGYFDGDYTDGSNTITLDVAVTMLDHSYNSSHPYTLGFTIWSAGTDSVDVMWSAQTGVQADGDDLPELVRQNILN